ncbi:MAG TPA: hypothetical protein VFU43_21235 [Streptosporangiaceae bacterium]|nr:hypothetical protein [Streptosporangiaceae bacterium]
MSALFVLLVAVFIGGCAVGAFAVLVLGIRSEERHMTVHRHDAPRSVAGASTRRVLGHVSRPDDDITRFAI